jgi:hypothetical protein
MAVVPNQRWWTPHSLLWIAEPINRQHFEHLRPAEGAATVPQRLGEKLVQPPLLPLPAAAFLLDHLDGRLPALDLRGGEFAQGQQPSLDDPLSAQAYAFAQRVVDVRLIVFVDDVALQKHVPMLPTFGRFG